MTTEPIMNDPITEMLEKTAAGIGARDIAGGFVRGVTHAVTHAGSHALGGALVGGAISGVAAIYSAATKSRDSRAMLDINHDLREHDDQPAVGRAFTTLRRFA